MAKVLNKTGIDTNEAIIANYVNNTTDALTGVDDYTINISGSSTITGSLKVLGDIDPIVNLTTVGVITAQTKLQALGNINAVGAIVGVNGNTILGDSINDPTTIKGNITGSGAIRVAGHVSASIIIGKANSLSFSNAEAIDQTMTTNSFPPGSVIGINPRVANASIEFTLPTPVGNAGLEYTFISNNNPSGGSTTMKIFSSTSLLNGIAICDDGTEDLTSSDTLGFAAEKFFKGTRIYCVSDGTIWHVTAFCLCDLADVSS
tara:strand:+ start:618 stop:1400 length:783 start_codon:yes stop_codon:yes gene_type:complete